MMEVSSTAAEDKPAGLSPLPRSIDLLPSLEDIYVRRGVEAPSAGYPEFFDAADRMIRLGDTVVLVFRHEDARRLGALPETVNLPLDLFLSRTFTGPEENPLTELERDQIRRFQANQFFTATPPSHSAVKPIFSKPLAPNAMPPFAKMGEDIALRMTDEAAGRGGINFMIDFAERYLVEFWGDVFEMTREERAALIEVLPKMLPISTGGARTRELLVELNQAIPEYFDLLVAPMRRAQASGRHVFLNWMSERFAAIDNPPDGMPESVEAAMAANMIDGFHAIAAGLTGALAALLAHPDALEAVRQDPAKAADAVAEGLRLFTPVPATPRYLPEALDYDGLHLPAHSVLILHWAAGNRDSSAFPDPNRYDPTRSQQGSGVFGAGVQICPGRNIARTLATAAIKALTRPEIRVRALGDIEWLPGSAISLPAIPERFLVSIERV